jgi:N-sulfoglucosamine sulfohydrolase
VRSGETDEAIRKRVELFQYRCTEELYDFQKDPDALNNLAGDDAYAEVLSGMRERMLDYMRDSQDTLIDYFYRRVMRKEDCGPHFKHE